MTTLPQTIVPDFDHDAVMEVCLGGQLQRLHNLVDLFASYWEEGGEPPSDHAISLASEYLVALAGVGIVPEAVNPSFDGSVCIEWSSPENGYDLIAVWNSGEVVAIKRRDGKLRVRESYRENVDPMIVEGLR